MFDVLEIDFKELSKSPSRELGYKTAKGWCNGRYFLLAQSDYQGDMGDY